MTIDCTEVFVFVNGNYSILLEICIYHLTLAAYIGNTVDKDLTCFTLALLKLPFFDFRIKKVEKTNINRFCIETTIDNKYITLIRQQTIND